MRTLLRIFALAPLVLPSVGPATSGAATIGGTPSDVVSSLAGHWRCTASNGSVTHRTYVVTDGGPTAGRGHGLLNDACCGRHSIQRQHSRREHRSLPAAGATSASGARSTGARTVPTRARSSSASPSGPTRPSPSKLPEGTATAPLSEAVGAPFHRTVCRCARAERRLRGSRARRRIRRRRPCATPAQAVIKPLSLSYAVDGSGLRRVARPAATRWRTTAARATPRRRAR